MINPAAVTKPIPAIIFFVAFILFFLFKRKCKKYTTVYIKQIQGERQRING